MRSTSFLPLRLAALCALIAALLLAVLPAAAALPAPAAPQAVTPQPVPVDISNKLLAGDGANGDSFGFSVSVDGDTAVVGARLDDVGASTDQGSAYVYVRSGGVWTQQQQLTASDGAALDYFGSSASVSGDTVVVGAWQNDIGANADQGSAYVFVRVGGVWTQQQQLTASDGVYNDQFGSSVSVSGDTSVVGAWKDDVGGYADLGSAYVFVRSGGVWTQQQQLTASDGAIGDYFGHSVAVDGDTVVVGADLDNVGASTDQGSAYVYVRSGGVWTQQKKLTAPDGAYDDRFGTSVAVSGDTAVVGAVRDDVDVNYRQGSAYVCLHTVATWACSGTTAQHRLWLDLNNNGTPDGGENDYTGPVDALVTVAGASRLLGAQSASGAGVPVQPSANPFDLAFRVPFAATWSTGAAGTGKRAVDALSANTDRPRAGERALGRGAAVNVVWYYRSMFSAPMLPILSIIWPE